MDALSLNFQQRLHHHTCVRDALSLGSTFVPAINAFRLSRRIRFGSCISVSDSLSRGVKVASKDNTVVLGHEGAKERIRRLFDKVELSISPYDTAWVAMVPSPHLASAPCFPVCVNWLLDNQLFDGSWGLQCHHPSSLKDSLLSTLACVLALKRWAVGEEHVNKGLRYIKLNFTSAMDMSQHSLIGFDIIFPGMIEYAKELGMCIPLEESDISCMLQKRDFELKRNRTEGREAFLAYVSEGFGKSQDWEGAMKYQRKNGSLFNSPSTTAAALMHIWDAGLLNYLRSVLEKFGNSVPAIYPLDVYARLCMVDNLERMGIDYHFTEEINRVLNETYRCWLQEDEEIFMDIATCAMAFRLLRTNGYDISSDPLTQICAGDSSLYSLSGHEKNMSDILELFKASQIIIYSDESTLERQNLWACDFLKQNLYRSTEYLDGLPKHISQEVDNAFKFPFHANLERLANRRNIKNYNVDSVQILKASYWSSNINNKDFLKLAVEDFNICQSIQREELKCLERWVVENNLDKLQFARQKLAYCYFSAAATLFSPDLSYARISWAKNGVLTTVVDDFFDIGGSTEELVNLIQLVQRWDVNIDTDCCSEQVKIIFSALHSTISEIGLKAGTLQSHSVTSHIIEIWLDLLNAMFREAEWLRNSSLPTIDEYMDNGYVSFALGPIVLPTLYFVGPNLSKEIVFDAELHNLYKLMSTCGRLLNDIHTYTRESKEGKLNAVSLRLVHSKGSLTQEGAMEEMKKVAECQRRELLKVVLKGKGSVIPKACKDLFWKMSKVLHLFYVKGDGFTSNEMIEAVKAVIYEPLSFDDM